MTPTQKNIVGRIAKLKSEIKELWADGEQLRAENKRLRSALEKVEWRASGAHFVCLWCGGLKRYAGHKPDCARQLALYPVIKQSAQKSSEEKESIHE